MTSANGDPEVDSVEAVPVAPLGSGTRVGFGRAGGPRRRPHHVDRLFHASIEVWDEAGPLVARPVRPAGSSRRETPARLVAAALALAVGVVVWKPWSGPARPADASPVPSAQAVAVTPPTPSGKPAPDRSGIILPSPLVGLDLSGMGVIDSHTTWGVSVAYVPRQQLLAAATGNAVVVPTVAWVPAVTAIRAQDLKLNHADSVVIAVAVTWPAASRPIGIQLMDRGTVASMQGGSGKGRSPGVVALSTPLPRVFEQAYPGAEWANEAGSIDWQLVSGTFFLAPQDLPPDVSGWLSSGWSPGSYAFLVTGPDGSIDTFPFRIQA